MCAILLVLALLAALGLAPPTVREYTVAKRRPQLIEVAT